VLLWGDPNWDTIIFECQAAQIVSPPLLQKLIEDMSRWNNGYFQGAKMYLRLPPLPKGAVMVGFSQKAPVPWQFDIGPQVRFSAVLHGAYAYFTVSFSSVLGSQPEELKDIPERFPPLETRIAAWPTSRLVEEIGKYVGTFLHPSEKRDYILFRELLTRDDFGPVDLKVLLSHRNACEWKQSARSFTEAAAKAHRAEEFARLTEEYFSKQSECPI
jgi:hypothetical protein